jgi:DNA topoisomerase-1
VSAINAAITGGLRVGAEGADAAVNAVRAVAKPRLADAAVEGSAALLGARELEISARTSILSQRWKTQGFREATAGDLERLRHQHGITFGTGYTAIHVNADEGADMVARAVSTSTGVDKRYYSRAFVEQQQAVKFARVRELDGQVARLDERLAADALDDDTAASVLVMRRTGMRPGSDAQRSGKVDAPDTFGATNLRARHATVDGNTVRFEFVGKGAKDLVIEQTDPLLARVVSARLATRSGDERLFATHEVAARRYIQAHLGPHFESKDLRTLHGTTLARELVAGMDVPGSATAAVAARRQVATHVSKQLGNTPAVALESYIDPVVFSGAGWP